MLDEPDVVYVGVVSGVVVRRERSATEKFGGGFLGIGKQQELLPLQQSSSSSSSSSDGLGGGTQSWSKGAWATEDCCSGSSSSSDGLGGGTQSWSKGAWATEDGRRVWARRGYQLTR